MSSISEYFGILVVILKLTGITSISNLWNQRSRDLLCRLERDYSIWIFFVSVFLLFHIISFIPKTKPYYLKYKTIKATDNRKTISIFVRCLYSKEIWVLFWSILLTYLSTNLPFSDKLQSSLSLQTICDFWYRLPHFLSFHIASSNQLEVNFVASLLGHH